MFLKNLRENNRRDWFNPRKNEYEELILQPAQAFVMALGEKLTSISKGMRYDPRTSGSGSVMRIYRDTRFSKDKTPYNTRVRFIFWEGPGKKMEHPGFFFGFDDTKGGIYCGSHKFSKENLAAYREAVNDDKRGRELEDVLDTVAAAGDYKIGGKHYKRVPRGFDPNHERATLLLYNSLYARSPDISPSVITKPKLVDVIADHFKNMAPMHNWLVRLDQQTRK